MSPYAAQTRAMLSSLSTPPSNLLGLPSKRETDLKLSLPTKRKRDLICGIGSFTDSFSIKPTPGSSYEKTNTFKPIRIIARSQLPLTFLDLTPTSTFLPVRLFSSQIDILEQYNGGNGVDCGYPRVLIARNESGKVLHVIERVQPRLYSVCKLFGWVKEKDVADLWDPSATDLFPTSYHADIVPEEPAQWWQSATVTVEDKEEDIRPTKRIRVSMLQPKDQPPNIIPTAVAGSNTTESVEASIDAPIEPVSPQQMCENLVQQYLETIYLSKTSLAYFAKGPISRVRSAFTSCEAGAPPTHELVSLFRSMLLNHKSYDRKFREKLPEMIKAIPPGDYSDDDAEGIPKTKKSKKKIKLNKDGMYPREEDMVKKWWISDLPSPEQYGEETLDQRIRRRVLDLRIRETLAQLILMLEIVALEAVSTYKAPEEVLADGADAKVKPIKRKKKLDDMHVQIDLIIDKLCIWQSVEQDDILSFNTQPSGYNGGDDPARSSSGDRLQSFCVEVIVPFYMSRLPEKANMVNKKLGGPVQHSPPKRKAAKPPVFKKPGDDAKEPEPKKSRRTLARVATDTTAESLKRPTPSLLRSTTEPSPFPGIKREGSEVPLSAIPFQRSPSAASRQSMATLKQLTRREIDLAPSAAVTAKMRQRKRVEDDLKEAITALKKPNRSLAAGGYADEVEKRKLGSGVPNKGKKPANPVRKISKDVLVSETPRAPRRGADIVEDIPVQPRSPFNRISKRDTPSSSDFCIPSSTVRPSVSMVPGTTSRPGTTQKGVRSSVAETPSKTPTVRTLFSTQGSRSKATEMQKKLPPSFRLNAPKFSDNPPKRGHDAVFETPSRPRSRQQDIQPLKTSKSLFSTPLKNSNTASSVQTTTTKTTVKLFSTPVKSGGNAIPQQNNEISPVLSTPEDQRGSTKPPAMANTQQAAVMDNDKDIYDALGWNDDDYL